MQNGFLTHNILNLWKKKRFDAKTVAQIWLHFPLRQSKYCRKCHLSGEVVRAPVVTQTSRPQPTWMTTPSWASQLTEFRKFEFNRNMWCGMPPHQVICKMCPRPSVRPSRPLALREVNDVSAEGHGENAAHRTGVGFRPVREFNPRLAVRNYDFIIFWMTIRLILDLIFADVFLKKITIGIRVNQPISTTWLRVEFGSAYAYTNHRKKKV